MRHWPFVNRPKNGLNGPKGQSVLAQDEAT